MATAVGRRVRRAELRPERGDTEDDTGDDAAERRRYPRLQAPVLLVCLPAPHAARRPCRVEDASLGGARTFSDARRYPGERLELELFLPGGETIVVRAQVAWVAPLPPASPAAYDVGLEFTDVEPTDADRLRAALTPCTD